MLPMSPVWITELTVTPPMRKMAEQLFGAFKKTEEKLEKLENYYKNDLPAIELRPVEPV